MNVSKILSAIAIAVMAASGAAHAETYEGAQVFNSVKSRSEVNAQAVETASAPNQNVTNGSRVSPALTSPADRSRINAEAIAAAQDSNQNLSRGAFVNSAVPAQYKTQAVQRQAGR